MGGRLRGQSLEQNNPGAWRSRQHTLEAATLDKSGDLCQGGLLTAPSARLSRLLGSQFCRHPSFDLSLTFNDLSTLKASRAPKNNHF